ncbi:MAG: hypothetical protein AB8G05_05560 [Oligoflexales bacterium]
MRRNINWDEAFKKYAEQGISDAAFCRQESISPSSFYKEKKARGIARSYKRRKPSDNPSAKPELVELSINSEQTHAISDRAPTVRLSNSHGVIIEVFL